MTPEEIKKLRLRCDELAVEFLGPFEDFDPYFRTKASLHAQAAIVATLINLDQVAPVCEECGHATLAHFDPYGCEYERGDKWVDGENMGAYVAQGPCGCKAWAVEAVAK
jgi:hypothetical protein